MQKGYASPPRKTAIYISGGLPKKSMFGRKGSISKKGKKKLEEVGKGSEAQTGGGRSRGGLKGPRVRSHRQRGSVGSWGEQRTLTGH